MSCNMDIENFGKGQDELYKEMTELLISLCRKNLK